MVKSVHGHVESVGLVTEKFVLGRFQLFYRFFDARC